MNLIFVVHNHQPVGNFNYVLEDAYKHAYKPFIDEILDVEEFRFAIHFSGYLLQYIEKNHPDFIEKLRYLIGTNRCEIITGGIYEPILILLPEKDRNEQIKRMNDYIERLFKVRPRGFWLAERVWEQQVASILSKNQIRYTFIDDTHFLREGIKGEELDGYFITENEGMELKLFPISKKLRYLIPFKNTNIVFNYLKSLHDENAESMALLGDDGEKFGVWPGTYKYVYKEGWLKKFTEGLKVNKEWLHMILPMEFIKKQPPKKRVYLRESSYKEMLEWSKGNFRNFLLKYPESNDMNKRSIYISKKALELGREIPDALLKSEANDAYWHGVFGGLYLPHLRIGIYQNLIEAEKEIDRAMFSISKIDLNIDGTEEVIAETPLLNAFFSEKGGSLYELDDKESDINLLNVLTRRKALELGREIPDALLKSEANDAYWHGVFGGLYLPHLRIGIYQNLIEAEKEIDRAMFSISKIDLNIDGTEEVIAETPLLNAFFSEKGGSLYELDDKESDINLLNVLTRRKEPYHDKIKEINQKKSADNNSSSVKTIHEIAKLKENDLDKFLIYDWYRRASFIDHFFREDTTAQKIYSMNFGEQGDFVIEKFDSTIKKEKEEIQIRFLRNGHVWHGENWEELQLKKAFAINKNKKKINAEYQISTEIEMFLFYGIEFNFMLFKDGMKINGADYKDFLNITDSRFEIEDFIQEKQITLTFSEKMTMWSFPIYTVSQSESGFEKTFQGLTFIFSKKWSIMKNKELFIELKL